MRIRLTQIDGKLPNLALMKLSSFHKAHGDDVHFTRHTEPQMDESPLYDRVYGSSIFKFSAPAQETFRREWPTAVCGGTGFNLEMTTEMVIGDWSDYDYSIYPEYAFSLGFTARGCRLSCGFCVVPAKEGRPKVVSTVNQIWRGEGHPKKICLLDNDFFGQPKDEWRARIKELNDGGFKVCFNQGLNVRLLDDESCSALSTLQYYDDQFKSRRLYSAWDNLRDESIFFRGVDMLEKAGIPPKHLMTYMLVGYDKEETWDRIFIRFNKMVERGINPYPMVFNNERPDLKRFQRWVIRRYYQFVPWEKYQKMDPIAESELQGKLL